MELMLPFPVVASRSKIKHGDEIILLGSCFADSMTEHFQKNGFLTISNPFGTVFHPLALADVIESSINDDKSVEIYQKNDLFFSWDASSKIYGMSSDELEQNVTNARKAFKECLVSARVLVITFGTSWGYFHTSLNRVVANCHKERKESFKKELSEVNEMVSRWQKVLSLLNALNSNLKVIFSVSPVRHAKDGLIDNNRSKARLIELTHQLSESSMPDYFPSYELVIDQLRDYRYFKRDMVHPSGVSVEHVWNFFRETYFAQETKSLAEKVNKINRSLEHIPLYPKSNDSILHAHRTLESKNKLKSAYPQVYWM